MRSLASVSMKEMSQKVKSRKCLIVRNMLDLHAVGPRQRYHGRHVYIHHGVVVLAHYSSLSGTFLRNSTPGCVRFRERKSATWMKTTQISCRSQ